MEAEGGGGEASMMAEVRLCRDDGTVLRIDRLSV